MNHLKKPLLAALGSSLFSKISLFALALCAPIANDVYATKAPLSIKLSTQDHTLPTSIELLETDNSISSEYVSKLLRIVEFDFHICESTFVVDPKTHRRQTVSNSGHITGSSSDSAVSPVFKLLAKVQNHSLIFDTILSGKRLKSWSVSLSGSLSKDRRLMHELSAKLQESALLKKSIVGQKVLYTLNIKDSSLPDGVRSEIWASDIDGYNAHRVSPKNDFCLSPSYVPSATGKPDQILFVNYKTGQPKLHIASIESGKSSSMLSLRGSQLLPALSKNRRVLGFICDAMGRADLFLQFFDGTKEKPVRFISYPGATQSCPSFDPFSKRVAFTSDKTGTPQIYVAAIDINKSPQLERLTYKSRQNTCPTWSPDGTKLAYVALTDGVKQVWIYDFTKSEERQLTFDPIQKESPAWAPNSVHLIYNTIDRNRSELYLLCLTTGQITKISAGLGDKKFPACEPWAK